MLISQIGPALPRNLTHFILLHNFHSDNIPLVQCTFKSGSCLQTSGFTCVLFYKCRMVKHIRKTLGLIVCWIIVFVFPIRFPLLHLQLLRLHPQGRLASRWCKLQTVIQHLAHQKKHLSYSHDWRMHLLNKLRYIVLLYLHFTQLVYDLYCRIDFTQEKVHKRSVGEKHVSLVLKFVVYLQTF